MSLQVFAETPTFLAVEQTSSIVHVVPSESPFARALCSTAPKPEWERIWKESVSRLSRPIGLCRSCWHKSQA